MYIIGKLSPLNQEQSTLIKKLVNFNLPDDYIEFLKTYGYGEINETIFITSADKNYLKNNFSGYMDLWEWKDEEQQKALEGLTIAKSIDGDAILCINNPQAYLLLPRYSDIPQYFDKLGNVFAHISQSQPTYFDSYYCSKTESISLIKEGNLDKSLIEIIRDNFTSKYNADTVFNDQQPKYVLQDIGGWVCFDLIYKNSIRIKYQTIYQHKANEIINFVKELYFSK